MYINTYIKTTYPLNIFIYDELGFNKAFYSIILAVEIALERG